MSSFYNKCVRYIITKINNVGTSYNEAFDLKFNRVQILPDRRGPLITLLF